MIKFHHSIICRNSTTNSLSKLFTELFAHFKVSECSTLSQLIKSGETRTLEIPNLVSLSFCSDENFELHNFLKVSSFEQSRQQNFRWHEANKDNNFIILIDNFISNLLNSNASNFSYSSNAKDSMLEG